MNGSKPSVLFVCTGNTGRSQMAQAMFQDWMGSAVEVESAKVEPGEHLHPMAVNLMVERGIGLEEHHPKAVSSLADRPFDCVVTIGDPARVQLPKAPFSAAYWMHWDIGYPADSDGNPDSESVFRAASTAIEERLPELELQISDLPRLSEYENRPGIGTGLWASERFVPSQHLPLVREAGFRAIELNLYKGRDHFDWDDPQAVRELRQVADDLGILIWSIHSPDLFSIASPDGAERQNQFDILQTCLDLADRLGSKTIASHALLLAPFEEDPEGCEERIAAFLANLTPRAEASPAQIGFENFGYSSAPAPARAVNILRRLKDASRAAYGFVLDTGHANIDGDLLEIGIRLEDHLISLHLNDNDGQGDTHLAPGEGSVNWSTVQHILRTSGYRGVIMYEIERGEGDPRKRLKVTMEGHRRYVV